jgi:hypothetical protein
VQVVQLALNPTLGILGAATYGRGMWVLSLAGPGGAPHTRGPHGGDAVHLTDLASILTAAAPALSEWRTLLARTGGLTVVTGQPQFPVLPGPAQTAPGRLPAVPMAAGVRTVSRWSPGAVAQLDRYFASAVCANFHLLLHLDPKDA